MGIDLSGFMDLASSIHTLVIVVLVSLWVIVLGVIAWLTWRSKKK